MFSPKKTLTAALAALTIVAAVAGPAAAKPIKMPHPHWGYGGLGVGLGLGLLGGAIAATAAASDCSIVRQPVTDVDGNFIGYANVRVCQ